MSSRSTRSEAAVTEGAVAPMTSYSDVAQVAAAATSATTAVSASGEQKDQNLSSYGSLSTFCTKTLDKDDEVARLQEDNETKLREKQQQAAAASLAAMSGSGSGDGGSETRPPTSKRKERDGINSDISYYAVRSTPGVTEQPIILFSFHDMALFLECSQETKQRKSTTGGEGNVAVASAPSFKKFVKRSDALAYIGYSSSDGDKTSSSGFFAIRPTTMNQKSILEAPVVFFGFQDMNTFIDYTNDRLKLQLKKSNAKGTDGESQEGVDGGELLKFKMLETFKEALVYVGKEGEHDDGDTNVAKRPRSTSESSNPPGWLTKLTQKQQQQQANAATTSETAVMATPSTSASASHHQQPPPSMIIPPTSAAAAVAAVTTTPAIVAATIANVATNPTTTTRVTAIASKGTKQQPKTMKTTSPPPSSSEPDFKAVAKSLVSEIIKSAGSSAVEGGGEKTSPSMKSSSAPGASDKEIDTSTEHIEALTGRQTGGSFVPLCSSGDIEGPAPISLTTGDKMSNRVRLQGLSNEERAKQNRDRNREHARNTRLRKKAYIEELKQTLTAMVEQRNAAEDEKRQTAKRDLEQREIRFRVIEEFLRIRGRHEPNIARWEAILDDDFCFTIPVTDYREMVSASRKIKNEPMSDPTQQQTEVDMDGSSGDGQLQQILSGVSQAFEDSRLFAKFLNEKGAGGTMKTDSPVPIYLQYYCERKNFFMDNCTGVLDWTASSEGAVAKGAEKELVLKGILKANFNPESNKLHSVTMVFDTGIVSSYLNQTMTKPSSAPELATI